MIIITLKGGLGNQMFQYSCGRAFSLRINTPLKLDVSGFRQTNDSETPRDYLLSNFLITEDIATNDEIKKLKYPYGIISKSWRYLRIKIFRKFYTDFESRLFSKINLSNSEFSTHLDGYWQTEKYFTDYADTIRKEFTLKHPFSLKSQAFSDIITKTKNIGSVTVSLHVRRGDVARDAWKNLYYGITTPEYYKIAMEALVAKINLDGNTDSKNIHIFVFSDDIEWVKQNIKIPFQTTYVSGDKSAEQIPDYEELILMSMCDHNIIANSSFSWWGAWLNKNPNKIVIAPKKWIRKKQWQHKDICPSTWIRV